MNILDICLDNPPGFAIAAVVYTIVGLNLDVGSAGTQRELLRLWAQ